MTASINYYHSEGFVLEQFTKFQKISKNKLHWFLLVDTISHLIILHHQEEYITISLLLHQKKNLRNNLTKILALIFQNRALQ